MNETFEQMALRVAAANNINRRHNNEKEYWCYEQDLISFATRIRDELCKGQEPVAETVTNDGCAYVYKEHQNLPVPTLLYRYPAPTPADMVKDAWRYRWLRDQRNGIDEELRDTYNKAVDAAIAAYEKEQGK